MKKGTAIDVGGLTSVVQNFFDLGEYVDSSMSNSNADLIAVSLACRKDPKSLS